MPSWKPFTDCLRKINILTAHSSGTVISGHNLPFKTSPAASGLHYTLFLILDTVMFCMVKEAPQYSIIQQEQNKTRFNQLGKNRDWEPDRAANSCGQLVSQVLLVQVHTDHTLAPHHRDKQFEWINTSRFMLASAGLRKLATWKK